MNERSEIVPFLFNGGDAEAAPAPVRLVMRDDLPWFVATDIARVLGFRDAEHAIRGLDDDEKGTHNAGTLGGQQRVNIISESGLYALVFRSRKPIARKFRRWVTEEVLPSIRRTGRYENTVAVGHHPQGPALALEQVEASLHQHQLRVLAALRALADDSGAIRLSGPGPLSDLTGLSRQNVRRTVRLLAGLGFVDLSLAPSFAGGGTVVLFGRPDGEAA